MSKIINPNAPPVNEVEDAIRAIIKQQREIIDAILVMQRDMADLKALPERVNFLSDAVQDYINDDNWEYEITEADNDEED